jgi:cell division protein FtsB
MFDIDLIPQAYRTQRWQTRWMKRTAFLMLGMIAILILSWSVLGVAITDVSEQVQALQLKQTATTNQRADIERLGAEKTELEQQFRLLLDLRSGAVAGDMFMTIDRALTSNDVWFQNWQFQRAGVMVGEEVRTVNTGYFVVVPDGADQLAADDQRVQTHMSIRGQARDHSALSGFVRRLFVQPEIDDIRIRRTSLSNGNQADTVDFELAVVLNTEMRVE